MNKLLLKKEIEWNDWCPVDLPINVKSVPQFDRNILVLWKDVSGIAIISEACLEEKGLGFYDCSLDLESIDTIYAWSYVPNADELINQLHK